MLASFGAAWIFMIAIPVAKMNAMPLVKISNEKDAGYHQRQYAGRILNGAEIYANNGCYTCHTQLIRPTYLGKQIWRQGMAGRNNDDGDHRRETAYTDFAGEKYAQIGLTRMGPDLSNFGYRAEAYAAALKISPEQWVISHLYNPRNSNLKHGAQGKKLDLSWSNCPAQPQMFEEKPINGQVSSDALEVNADSGTQVLPTEQARVLASYLLSLKRDEALPESLDYSPKKKGE